MFAELITIGDELLIGQVVDTNSAWMGRELNNIGIEVLRIVSVRDREEEILEAIDNAMKRVNIVLVTGGLGPTKDDITKQTLCKYFNTELIFSEEVFENVKRVLAGKIPMNKLNKGQAMVPKNCTVINNPIGSASVSWFERRCAITSVVRFFARCSRESCTIFSLSLSSADVASSKIKIGGFFKNTRASDNRCF